MNVRSGEIISLQNHQHLTLLHLVFFFYSDLFDSSVCGHANGIIHFHRLKNDDILNLTLSPTLTKTSDMSLGIGADTSTLIIPLPENISQ
jgi:hypothetical protein